LTTITFGAVVVRCPYAEELRPLSAEERASLREDIRAHGLVVPVVLDESGDILDGFHRATIAAELGYTWDDVPRTNVHGLSPEEKREIARSLNFSRRHFSKEEIDAEERRKREKILQLAQEGKSLRVIAAEVGEPKSTVYDELKRSGVRARTPEVVGRDGKSYPASRPAPAADTAPPREERRTGTFLPDPPSAPISGEAPALADPIREDAAPATASSALEVTPVVLVTATKPPFEEEGLLCPGCMEKPCACKACWICQSEDSGPLVWDRELLTCRACTPGVFEEEPAPVPLPFEEAPAGEARSPVAATVDALFARVEAQGVDPLAASAEQLGAEEPGESAKEARAARLAKVEERRQERLQVIAAEASGAEGQPERGRYGVLYVDPPWEYNQHRESRFGVPYPTLSRDELRRLDVARLCTRDAVLFLWATSPLLPEALALVAAWGFSYKSSWVWVKTTLGGEPAWGLGSWGRVAHELVLICTRGEMPTPSPAALPQSVFLSTRKEHSKKPFEVRAAIEEMYPTLPRVEVFAREAAPGWAAIGNEIDGRDIREVLGRREVAE
jgi:N6-adenosine-specific RNA methylase IME4